MKKKISIFILAVLMLPLISLTVQLCQQKKPVATHQQAKGQEVLPGEVVNYQVEIKADWLTPVDEQISLPSLTGVQVTSQPKVSLSTAGFASATWQLSFALAAYDLTDKDSFKLKIPFKSLIGKRQRPVELQLPLFKVKTDFESTGRLALSDTVDKLTAPPKEFPVKTVVITISVLAVLLLLTLLLKGREKEVKKVVVPPWVTANAKLENIKGRLPIPGEQFFVELSDLLRLYIEALYKLPATETTTKEFLSEMQRSSLLKKETKQILGSFLMEADMIKFAKQLATEDQMMTSLETAGALIKNTADDFINKEGANA